MRRYETIYILRPTLNEDEINTVIENTNSILQIDSGQIINLDQWGLRKLAYLIHKETQGYYVYCDFATDPTNVSEMERKFRIDDSVMKYMTVKLADSITAEGIDAARGEHEAAAEAAAVAAAEAEAAAEETRRPASAEKKAAKPSTESETKAETKVEAKVEANVETETKTAPATEESPAADDSAKTKDESDS